MNSTANCLYDGDCVNKARTEAYENKQKKEEAQAEGDESMERIPEFTKEEMQAAIDRLKCEDATRRRENE